MGDVLTGREFGQAVCAMYGVDPKVVRRVVVDATPDDVVTVYLELDGGRFLLDLAAAVDAGTVKVVAPDPPVKQPRRSTPAPPERTVDGDPLVCEVCGRSFTTRQRLESHRGVHVMVPCDVCGSDVARTGLGAHRRACEAARLEQRRAESPGAPSDSVVDRRRRAAAEAAYLDGI